MTGGSTLDSRNRKSIARFFQRRQQFVRIFPDANVVRRNRAGIVRHGAVTPAKPFRISDALVDGLDRETGRGRQCGVFPEHPLDCQLSETTEQRLNRRGNRRGVNSASIANLVNGNQAKAATLAREPINTWRHNVFAATRRQMLHKKWLR